MNPAHLTNLKKLCEQIEAGYAANKSGLDDDMVPLLVELADETALIKELIELGTKTEPFGAPAAEQAEPVAADHARKELSDMLMSFAVIRELTKTQQDSAEETVEAVRGALNSASTYFAERNSARDVFWRRVKQCEELEAKLAAAAAPPAPARQEPLTEEQIDAVCKDSIAVWVSAQPGSDLHKFARAIERAHGITAAPAEGGAA